MASDLIRDQKWHRRPVLWFERKWLKLRWWLLMGGDTNRHPYHFTVWGLVITALGVVAGSMIALGSGVASRVIGFIALALIVYIVISFFAPLWLPPIWNER